jgi:hypothetical protein
MRPPGALRVSLVVGATAMIACSLTSLDGFSVKPSAGSDGQSTEAGPGPARDSGPPDALSTTTYLSAVLADDPLGYWRFEETSGTSLHDEMGRSDAVVHGNCTLGAESLPGIGGRAIAFDGASCVLDVGTGFEFAGQAPFTIEAWVRRLANDFQHLFTRQQRGNQDPIHGYALVINEFGESYLERVVNQAIDATPSIAIPTGSFVHLVATFNGDEMVVYRDGVEAAREADTNDIPTISAQTVIGAKAQGGGYFSGVLDEVAIYGKALPRARVAAHHDAALAR